MISARRHWLDQQQYSKPDRSPMARHHQHSERKREGGESTQQQPRRTYCPSSFRLRRLRTSARTPVWPS